MSATQPQPHPPASPTSDCQQPHQQCPFHVPPPAPVPYVNPIARVLLAAVLKPSPNSPFSILSACPDVLYIIYSHLRRAWHDTIIPPPKCLTRRGRLPRDRPRELTEEELSRVALCRVGILDSPFPEPSGLYCNMLPFKVYEMETFPPEYNGYINMINQCSQHVLSDLDDVWYLTIHESKIEPGRPQRREGLHVEGFLATPAVRTPLTWWSAWGQGSLDPISQSCFESGIFHASSVTGSCRMWNAQIPRQASDALSIGCDVEHLRGVLGEVVEPILLAENELYWFTDATPHESLPCEEGYRQYFRLVTGKISAWWEKHCTPNRLGVQPDCPILKRDKFEKDAYVGIDMGEQGGPSTQMAE